MLYIALIVSWQNINEEPTELFEEGICLCENESIKIIEQAKIIKLI